MLASSRIVNVIPTLVAMWLSIKTFTLPWAVSHLCKLCSWYIHFINKASLEYSTYLLLICLHKLTFAPVSSILIDSNEKFNE